MDAFAVGQRWSSEMEPELGVGIVAAVEGRRVHLRFPQGDVVRIYAAGSAPLQRVRFHPGDRVADDRGATMAIERVAHDGDLLVYHGRGLRLREDRLSARLTLDHPKTRLMAGQRDTGGRFDLRWRVLDARRRLMQSAIHGFVGGRVDLIAHQFAIAAEVSRRHRPRVLLADETGLGKTIEAGLVLHRLLAIGRIQRVLVLVPDALVVQWFVELARRFNLQFRILDNQWVRDHAAAAANPLDDEPLGLCGFDVVTAAPPALQAHLENGDWDMLVVDEAHHLAPESPLYERVRRLSDAAARVILITATPGHLDARGHFARLRLLDRQRFDDYGRFQAQSRDFEQTARMARSLMAGGDDAAAMDPLPLAALLDRPPAAVEKALASSDGRQRLLSRLIDRHGTGRVMFRTTRGAVGGFPGRRARLVPVVDAASDDLRRRLNREFREDCGLVPAAAVPAYDDDPRVGWLVDFMRAHRGEKTLLICRSADKVNGIYAALGRRINLNVGRYHEAMTLVQRDRNAAWFADPGGAVLLLCSEIGSEGRNFQFSRRLVLFDLPADADLLEQRIGRLDRIGQAGVVQVMVPYVPGTGGEVLARWYHEALDLFDRNHPAASWVTRRLIHALTALVTADTMPDGARLERMIRGGRIAAERQARRIAAGRDRLLALDALPPQATAQLMASIRAADDDAEFLDLAERLLDDRGIQMEAIAPHIFRLLPDQRYADPLPGFRPGGMAVTTDRATALSREELGFLTWDHPLVMGAMEHYLGSGTGNCAFVQWAGDAAPAVLLEMVFMAEAAAGKNDVHRFLPPTPVRVAVDSDLNDGARRLAALPAAARVDGSAALLARLLPLLAAKIPPMVDAGRRLAGEKVAPIIRQARADADRYTAAAVDRLTALAEIDAAAVDSQRRRRDAILSAIDAATLRLDAVCLVLCGTLASD